MLVPLVHQTKKKNRINRMDKDLAIQCISEQILIKQLHKAMLSPNINEIIINRFIYSIFDDIKDMEYNDKSDVLTEEIKQLKDTIRLIKRNLPID